MGLSIGRRMVSPPLGEGLERAFEVAAGIQESRRNASGERVSGGDGFVRLSQKLRGSMVGMSEGAEEIESLSRFDPANFFKMAGTWRLGL